MLANVRFRDVFATFNAGLLGSYASGTNSSNPIQLAGSVQKLLFRFLASMTASSSTNRASATVYLQDRDGLWCLIHEPFADLCDCCDHGEHEPLPDRD